MKKKSNASAIFALGSVMLSLAFVAAGAQVTIAQSSPFGGPSTTIGGTSPLNTSTTPLLGTTPTAPSTTPTQFGSGPTSSTKSNFGITSAYCANVKNTILASGSKVSDVIQFFTCLIQGSIIPLLFMLAFAVFVWGMVKFISSQQSAEKEDGKQFMLWGVIALAVMFSVWGLVKIFQDTFQIKNAVPQLTIPK